jgi:hypothetical protein
MIFDHNEEVSIRSVDEFFPEYLDELKEDIILERRMRNSHRGEVDYLLVGLKGTHRSKAKWIDTSTYCKNSDVLFAALWTKLSILSQNRGNLKKKKIILPDNVGLATLTSLLPR